MGHRALTLAVLLALCAPIAGCFENLKPPRAEQAETEDTTPRSER